MSDGIFFFIVALEKEFFSNITVRNADNRLRTATFILLVLHNFHGQIKIFNFSWFFFFFCSCSYVTVVVVVVVVILVVVVVL